MTLLWSGEQAATPPWSLDAPGAVTLFLQRPCRKNRDGFGLEDVKVGLCSSEHQAFRGFITAAGCPTVVLSVCLFDVDVAIPLDEPDALFPGVLDRPPQADLSPFIGKTLRQPSNFSLLSLKSQ